MQLVNGHRWWVGLCHGFCLYHAFYFSNVYSHCLFILSANISAFVWFPKIPWWQIILEKQSKVKLPQNSHQGFYVRQALELSVIGRRMGMCTGKYMKVSRLSRQRGMFASMCFFFSASVLSLPFVGSFFKPLVKFMHPMHKWIWYTLDKCHMSSLQPLSRSWLRVTFSLRFFVVVV